MKLPDFIIIGAMKSGTTTLFRWLGDRDEVFVPPVKEPDFFSRDELWERGVESYAALFDQAPPGRIAGEASASYTDPLLGGTAAMRMARVVPDARLIYLVREPIDRLRSHYRHQVQRGRERRTLQEAVSEPGNEYVGRSLYFTCLQPYIEEFPREQICVVRTEDLGGAEDEAWIRVLAHVGLSPTAPPGDRHNTTSSKGQYTRPMLWMWERGLLRWTDRVPRPVRKLGRRILMRDGSRFDEKLRQSHAPVPTSVSERIRQDVSRLQVWLGSESDLWPRTPIPDPSLAGGLDQKRIGDD